MSNKALNWAFQKELKPATTKFVLVAMCDRINSPDWVFFEGIQTLVERTGLNRKTVLGSISQLLDKGLILDTGKRRGRTGKIVVFKINWPGANDPSNNTIKQGQKRDDLKKTIVPILPSNGTENGQSIIPKTDSAIKRNPKKNPNEPKRSVCARFDQWYEHYPLKKARGAAKKAFDKLNPDEPILSEMIQALCLQKAEKRAKQTRGEWVENWKHPATWINGRCWEDEPDPATGSKQQDNVQRLPLGEYY